jgi:hypothetical protein
MIDAFKALPLEPTPLQASRVTTDLVAERAELPPDEPAAHAFGGALIGVAMSMLVVSPVERGLAQADHLDASLERLDAGLQLADWGGATVRDPQAWRGLRLGGPARFTAPSATPPPGGAVTGKVR